MRTSSSLLLSVLTIVVIMISTIASILLFGNALMAVAQPSQLSQPATPGGEERIFQSIGDSFSVLVPEGWVIQDLNNTGFRLLAEVLQGYGVVAQLCPQGQQPQELSNLSRSITFTGTCQASQGENIIHIIRYPNLGARLEFASADISTTNNTIADDILGYQIQKLQEVGYRNINIVKNTDTTVNIDTSIAATNTNNTLSEATTVPAKLVEMTYSTSFAPNETRTGYFISTATDVTPRNLGMISGYGIFYEGSAVASTSAAETTMPSASSPPPSLPAAVRQVFDSFELIASAEAEQAIQAEQQQQVTNPLTVELISNDTEGVAPATFEFEANIMDGTQPYTISWDFDDGSEESGDEENVVHTFDDAGTYNVNLTITDSLDQIASDSIEITIEESPTTATTAEEDTSAATTTGTNTGNDNNVPSTDATNGNENNNVVVRIPQGASELTDDAYSPNPVEVRVGDTVTWINDDSTSHTATAGTPDSGSTGLFGGTDDSPEIIEPEGGTQSFTFDEAGEFPYYCTLHPNMVGTVMVTEQ